MLFTFVIFFWTCKIEEIKSNAFSGHFTFVACPCTYGGSSNVAIASMIIVFVFRESTLLAETYEIDFTVNLSEIWL